MQRTSNILVRSLLSATSLLGGLAMVHGQAVTVDGTRDYLYGFPRVWQTVQTGFGENLSELNNAYSYIGGGKLNLFLGSNLEGNGNRIYVFLDTNSASGQNVLRGDNGDGALNALAGLKLEPGFAPDHGFVFNTGGGVNLYANYGSLPAGAGGTGEYLGNSLVGGGSGTLTGSSNLMGVMASFNNSNTGGVGGGTSDNQVPSDVATGLEISIPLGSLGIVDQSVKVFAFISDNTGLLSNQFLPDVGNGTSHGIYGSPGVVDFGDAGHPGKQFFYVQPRTKNAFWATRVSSFGTASLGSGAAGPAAIVRLDPATPNQSPTDLISLSGGVSGSRASSLGSYAYSDYLKRTSDGTKALYFGYSGAPGDAGIATTTGRTLAWVSADQSLTFRNFTTTANSNRGAVSFESDVAFFANSGNQIQLSSPTTTTLVSSPNARVLNTFNNRLYWGASSSVNAFQFIPTGSATSASIGSLGLSNAQDFTFADARTLYVLRDSASSSVTSAVCKYVYSGVTSTWGLAYVLESSLLGSSYARALQIAKTSSGIDLFVTTGTSGQSANNRVYKITDNGTSLAVVTTLTTLAGANVSYRGIDWSPELWQAPVANHDTASTDDATPINGNAATNDAGEYKQGYAAVGSSGPGSFSLNPDGTYTYTPDGNPGTAILTYKFNDTDQDSNQATVTVTVTGGNTAPVANDANFTTDEGTIVNTPVVASDGDNDVLTYSIVTPPAHGTIGGTAPNWTYTPSGVFSGSDSFVFKVNDGTEDSNNATVTLSVNDTIGMGVNVKTSPAPNYYGSPNYDVWEARALDRWLNADGAPQFLRSEDPSAFETPSSLVWSDATVTNFPFWLGVLNPTLPFAAELGHRPTFTTRVLGHGTRFSLHGLEFDIHSNDPALDENDFADMFGWNGWWDGTDPGDPGQQYYNAWTVGIDYGPDRIRGTWGDNIIYENGEAAELPIDELVYVGLGNAFEAVTTVSQTDPVVALRETRAYFERKIAATGSQVDISVTFKMHAGDVGDPVLGQGTQVVPLISNNVAPTAFGLVTAVDENSANNPVNVTPATDTNSFEMPLLYEVVDTPDHGSLSGAGPNWVYTPSPNYAGPDSFTYRVKDVTLYSAPATVNITVNNTNDPPVASNASYTTDENTPVAATGSATDPNGDTMTYVVVTSPTHGLLSGTAPNWVYTPNANFAGVDSFSFKANDGSADSNEATVSLTVNDTIGMAMQAFVSSAPNAYGSPNFVGWRDRALNSLENTPGIEDGSRLTDPTAYEIVNEGPWWEAVVTGFPSWLGGLNPVAPFDGEYGHRVTTGLHILGHGTQFKLEDLEFDMSSTDPTNTLTYVGDFVGLTYAPHRVGIDYGPDRIKGTGDDLRYNTTATPGSVMIDELVYVGVGNSWAATVPEVGATPYEAMQSARAYIESVLAGQPLDITTAYAIRPGHTGLPLATASDTLHLVSTNTAPLADDQTVSVGEDGSTGITLSGSDGDLYEIPLEYTVTGGPSHGTLSGTAPNLVYTPDPNYFGPDAFTFVTTDVALDSLEATVTINVTPVNDPPILNAIGNQPVNEGSDLIINLGGSDIDSTTLTYSATGLPAGATLVGNTFSWNPSEIQGPGVYPVTFEVSDGAGGMDSELVVITVAEVNIAPAASNQSVATDVNELVNISLVATDEDLPANTLTYTIVSLPTHGTLSQTGADVTYTPDLDYSGPDSFTFKANDGTVDSNVATVNISVAGTTITLDLTLQGYLPDGETIRGMTMWLGGTTGGANPPVDVSRDVTFDSSGHATIVFVSQDGFLPTDDLSTYAISVKDDLHTLRKMEMLHWDGDNYTANVTLVGGNLNRDNKVDIADYVVYAVRSGQTVDPNTPLALHANPLFRHADISGDGDVDSEEFSFIQATFGQFDDDLVGNYSRGNNPIRVRIRVSDAILEAGTKNAALLDRNRDGWITMDEAKTPLSPTRR